MGPREGTQMLTPARITIGLLLAAGIFLAGYTANQHAAPADSATSVKHVLSYSCPMHPQYKSDHPGDCPLCGMRLVPADASSKTDAASDMPGMVQISADKQQLIGVRTDEVRRAASSHLLRVPGRIAVDDQRLYRIVAAADGWIVELGQNTVGRFVKKNQLLASYYQKDLLASERLFLLSIPSNEPLQTQTKDFSQASIRTAGSANPQFPIDALRGLGMSDLQIEEIHRTRAASPHIDIYSPVSGFVLVRNISPGQRFDKGTEMYRIGDIGHIWVLTDIFEKDRDFVKPGAVATVRYRGHEFPARLSDVLPQFDPQSRTLKTRFEVDNPGFVLRPDMFVDVEVHVDTPSAVTVPADAVIDSGRRKTVYVEHGSGEFGPRQVETGWRFADRVEIIRGLEPGERIVVGSNFLIDSESRMKLTAVDSPPVAEKAETQKDPVCGMEVDPDSPHAITAQYRGKTWHFCSEGCKRTFQANPDKYAPKKESAQDARGALGPA
jgi:membrane fusion protein, copper/silver efflux system